jgi:hypothetical protein
MKHYEESALIPTSAEKIFTYADDHERFSSHMSTSSWMMGGGKMVVELDEGRGQKVGSHIRLRGKAFGITVFLDEVITEREPPRIKIWETVGMPKLVIIGSYRLGFKIKEEAENSRFRVFIDYDLPPTNRWLGYLFARMYARWCVRQMIAGVRNTFLTNK